MIWKVFSKVEKEVIGKFAISNVSNAIFFLLFIFRILMDMM